MDPGIDIQRQLLQRQGLHLRELVFQAEVIDLREVVTRDVGSAEGIVRGFFSIGCGGGGGGGRGGEYVPRLHGHVDSDYQVLVVETAEHV